MDAIPQTKSALDPEVLRRLLGAAREVAAHAHAPYSHFHVGAAVLDDKGRIFAGCNVENASFGLTMCAERNAVGAAVAAGAARLTAVTIYTASESLTTPCGACRQVLSEFGRPMEVHLCNREGRRSVYLLEDLLPAVFSFETRTFPKD
jgi:cytidine deaminase